MEEHLLGELVVGAGGGVVVGAGDGSRGLNFRMRKSMVATGSLAPGEVAAPLRGVFDPGEAP